MGNPPFIILLATSPIILSRILLLILKAYPGFKAFSKIASSQPIDDNFSGHITTPCSGPFSMLKLKETSVKSLDSIDKPRAKNNY